MAVADKRYTFTQNLPFDASEVNRNFNDIYNAFNGNVDSANIVSTFTIDDSNVVNGDTATYSSNFLNGVLDEIALATVREDIQAFSEGLVGNLGSACQQFAGHIYQIEEPGITASDVIALYLFASADLVNDEKDTYDLENVCQVVSTSGIFGDDYAAKFSGSTALTRFRQSILLDTPDSAITIDCWVEPLEHQSTSCQILFWKHNIDDQESMEVGITTEGRIYFNTEEGASGAVTLVGNTRMTSGTGWWHHICVTWHTAGKSIWLDSINDGTDTSSCGVMGAGADSDFAIGANSAGLLGLEGKMANVRVMQKVPSQNDVDIMYAVKRDSPTSATFSSTYFQVKARLHDAGDSEAERQVDWDSMEVVRNNSSIYQYGALLDPTDRLALEAG